MWNTKGIPEYLKTAFENQDDFTRHTEDFYDYLKKVKKKMYRDKNPNSIGLKNQIHRVLGAVQQLDCDYRLYKWVYKNENHSGNNTDTITTQPTGQV